MASKRIAGITIEIGGDTTKLQSALKGVDSQLSKTQSNLKDINKLLKLNPGNTDLLVQKQKNLKSAISDTEKRLKELKEAQKQVGKGTAEYDALQREIIETENDLKSLKKEYKQFGTVAGQKLQLVGNRIKNVGQKMTKFGSALTKKVTAPIIAVGAAAYASFNEVKSGLDIIVKKTGVTGKALDNMETILDDVVTSIPTDFETAGEAIGEVNTKFGVTDKKLNELSKQYIKFASINNVDVTTAVDNSQKALAAFGLGADDASTYLDHLTAVSQKTGVDVGTLSTTVTKNATALKAMGLSVYDATELMGQLEMSGVDSASVMNALSKSLKNATAKGIPLDKALGDLQNSIKNGTGATDGLTQAYKLFGANGAQVYEAVKNGTLDFNALAGSAETTGDTVSNTFDATIGPSEEFTMALNALKITGKSIAAVVMPALSKILNKVKDVIIKLKAKWDGLSDTQKKNIVRIAGIVAAVGPLLLGFGKVVSIVGTVIKVLGMLNPVVLLIGAAIAALAVLVIKNWDKIKAYWDEKLLPMLKNLKQYIVDNVVPAVKAAWESFKEKVRIVFNAVKDFWKNNRKPTLQELWTWINNKLIPSVKTAWEGLKTKISNVFEGIKNLWNNTLKPTLQALWSWITTQLIPAVKVAWEGLKTKVKAVFDGIKNLWNNTLKPALQALWAWINTQLIPALKTAWEGLKTKVKAVFDGIKNLWNNTLKPVMNTIKTTIVDTVIPKVKDAWNSISPIVSKVFKAISTAWILFGKPIINGIANTISTVFETVQGVISGIITFIKGTFTGDWRTAWSGIKQIFNSIWNGISTLLKTPINAVIKLINKMLQAIEDALGKVVDKVNGIRIKTSPIRVFGKEIFPAIDWGPKLKKPYLGRVPLLANGGILHEGQRAIVGEYAPEYLTVRNGQAVVTPMNTGRFGGNTVNNTFNIYAQPGMNVQDIANAVGRIFTRQAEQQGAAYA